MLERYGDFLDIEETAVVLHISEWSARDLCRKGKLPSVKVGRRILIPKNQLIEHIEMNMKGRVCNG